MAQEARKVAAGPSPRLTERSLSYLVRHAHRAFVRALGEQLAVHGINVAEWAVLRMLWQEDDIAPAALAQRMHVQKASLTSVLDALERKNCLRRVRDETDRRKLRLLLTPFGRGLEDVLLPYGLMNNNHALRGINPRDAETARRVLEAMIANLDAPA